MSAPMQITYDLMPALDAELRAAAAQTEIFDDEFSPELRPADPRFGDFQANGVLPFAKKRGLNPREAAQSLIEALVSDESREVKISGPGFLNFRLTPTFRLEWLRCFGTEEALREGASADPKSSEAQAASRVVLDFSSPNTAKQMHVGHVRSTIIGDVLARILAFTGSETTRDNHVGDWGTQFGILILAIKRSGTSLEEIGPDPLAQLEDLYREGTILVKEDEALADEARAELVKLQGGDPENHALWQKVSEISFSSFRKVYDLLGVRFDEQLGESFYRDKVDAVYESLTRHGICEEDAGALVVFHPEHKRFAKQPFIVRKSDGASNYATTDLATVKHRVDTMQAEEIIYVTDARQKDHFEQLFLTCQKWFTAEDKALPRLRHVHFGTILGEDNKAIKTREGQPIKLIDLLNEAVSRARAIVDEKTPELPEEEKVQRSRAIGLGAVRYADLSQDRTLDYVFSWDKLLALQGNTAPYLQYAATRVLSIFRKAGLEPGQGEEEADAPATEAENALARRLIFFPAVLDQTRRELKPHHLCAYLYDLATDFSSFYNADKVMVEEANVRARRLMLCARVLLFLDTGLGLLGIERPEGM